VKQFSIDHARLQADFCQLVRQHLTAAELAAVNLRNSCERNPDRDHLHDFVDANEIMQIALQRQNLTPLDAVQFIGSTWQRCRDTCYQLRRVLVACEFSGAVRDAIAQYGHDVISCDILPTESPGKHYQGDVRDILNDGWTDMLSFPDCTYLCGSGAKHRKNNPTRWKKTIAALDFVRDLMAAPMDRQMLENSVGMISTKIRKPEQYIQPYQFGHDHSKKTCLWLDNLPPLEIDPADYVPPHIIEYRGKPAKRWSNQSPCGADKTAPGPNRWKIRAATFPNIARAFAAQWFNPVTI